MSLISMNDLKDGLQILAQQAYDDHIIKGTTHKAYMRLIKRKVTKKTLEKKIDQLYELYMKNHKMDFTISLYVKPSIDQHESMNKFYLISMI